MARPTLDDVTPALFRALDRISLYRRPAVGVRELGRELDVGAARASQLVERLDDLGWTMRPASGGVVLTALGYRVLAAYVTARDGFARAVR